MKATLKHNAFGTLKKKIPCLQLNVLDIDGHNIAAVIEAVNEARKVDDRPTVIIARTIAGKGKFHGRKIRMACKSAK